MTARGLLLKVLDPTVGWVMRHAPSAIAHGLAGVFAQHVGPRLYPRGERQARENFPRLRPDLPLGPAMVEMRDNIARTMMEVPRLGRMVAEGRMRAHGTEHLAGRPLLVAGLHLGNWEFIGPAMTAAGAKPAAIYQPVRSAYRTRVAVAARRPWSTRLWPGSPAAARPALRALTHGEGVLLMFLDEFVGGRVAAPSLGRGPRRGGNITAIARMARLAGAEVVLAWCLRRPGPRFEVFFAPPLHLPERLEDAVALLDAAAEAVILPNLPQWFMLHEWRPHG